MFRLIYLRVSGILIQLRINVAIRKHIGELVLVQNRLNVLVISNIIYLGELIIFPVKLLGPYFKARIDKASVPIPELQIRTAVIAQYGSA